MAATAFAPCPYQTLGLWLGASPDDVRTAYRRAVLRTHPDKPGGSTEAFNEVQRAYTVLSGESCQADTSLGWAFGPGLLTCRASTLGVRRLGKCLTHGVGLELLIPGAQWTAQLLLRRR
ncbi:unnamed protein product [Polarella glacialis]|uniref:J domain-containing protein n=1 Tax=Polarella glacialis TaxID=89957 RepID=A0A813HMR0_POLGL|nr:unnamed protein product [Polarella glacialis]